MAKSQRPVGMDKLPSSDTCVFGKIKKYIYDLNDKNISGNVYA